MTIDRDALLADLRLGRDTDAASPELNGEARATALAVWAEVLNRIEAWPDAVGDLADALRPYEQDLTIGSGRSIRGIVILVDAERAAALLTGRS
jgi:hypothetical protein